jgi:hypothetical protein
MYSRRNRPSDLQVGTHILWNAADGKEMRVLKLFRDADTGVESHMILNSVGADKGELPTTRGGHPR